MHTPPWTQARLDAFTSGTEKVWQHPLYGALRYTDGVRAVAVEGEAWWLTDIIATSSKEEPLRRESFLNWTLTRGEPLGDGMYTATLRCTDGDGHVLAFPCCDDEGREILQEQRDFSMTDFPLETITIWVIDQLMMLPSEY